MKITRVSLLLVALSMSFLAAPQAFGAKAKGARGSMARNRALHSLASDCYYIYCGGSFPDAGCCGSVGECLDVCDGVCGVPSGTCIYVP